MPMELNVFELLRKRALITRDSAQALAAHLFADLQENEVVLDFKGVDAVTPSFVDELLSGVETGLRARQAQQLKIVFLNCPTRLSAKFTAIARARRLQISESEEGTWTITGSLAQEAV